MKNQSRGPRGRKPTETDKGKRLPRKSQDDSKPFRPKRSSEREGFSKFRGEERQDKDSAKRNVTREKRDYRKKTEDTPRFSDNKFSGRKRNFPAGHSASEGNDFKEKRPPRFTRPKDAERTTDDSRPYRPQRTGFRTERPVTKRPRPVKADPNAPIRLNKFIANAGVCSRREADKLIESGAVSVNGVIVTELGTKVSPADKVQLGDQTLSSEKFRYVLLNKPKAYITTTDDPFKRNTVMSLVKDACKERIYPVGRLDRNTTGLLLFTNDGELAKRLTHPRFGVRKIYDVELDKPLSKRDMESIAAGVELDGETILIDEIAYVSFEKNKNHIGIELHSGQNRVVRRIFEKFGYEVVKLDRVMIGSLTKKDLQRGRWRHLTDLEVRMLKRL